MSGARFFSWRQAFMEDSSLTSTQKLLLHTLATFMNQMGDSCYPSVERLADRSSLARETVIRQLKALKKAGWIRVDLHGFSRQKWRRHEYSIGWPNGVEKVEKGGDSESPRMPEGGDSGSPRQLQKVVILSREGGDPECGKVVTHDHPNTPENYPENYPERARRGAPAREPTADKQKPKPSPTRGHRLPDDWTPGNHLLEWADDQVPRVDVRTETETFIDHWRAQPGAKGRKTDWDATWRNWMRRAVSFGPPKSRHSGDMDRGAAGRVLE